MPRVIKKKRKATSSEVDKPYVKSISRQAAEKMLNEKLRKEGFSQGRSDSRSPSFKLSQDAKTKEYIFRKS